MQARNTAVVWVLLAAASVAWAGGVPPWLGREIGQAPATSSYRARGFFQAGVDGQQAEMCYVDHLLTAAVPIHQDEQTAWTADLTVGALHSDTDGRLPATRDAFPPALWDVRVGLSHRRRLSEAWTLGLRAEVGSPSDRPFASGSETVVAATGTLRWDTGESTAWAFLLNWTNDREFLRYAPLPGVAWLYEPSDDLSVMAGVPMSSARWRPAPRLTLEGTYLLLRTVHAKVSYELAKPLSVYAAFDMENRRYLRHDRADDDDRLAYYAKRVAGGVRWRITRYTVVDVSGGWAFDRFFFEGEDYDDRGRNRLDLADGAFLALTCRLRF